MVFKVFPKMVTIMEKGKKGIVLIIDVDQNIDGFSKKGFKMQDMLVITAKNGYEGYNIQ
ncbi:MAG: hypothetical protein CM15mP4_2340 [Candidatus Neomarinimicrobiota bacterium]|nr:MAG: hypothetical protein CM15mP4_2340 [Candidatus Neomarinimicrobiota bacterium]